MSKTDKTAIALALVATVFIGLMFCMYLETVSIAIECIK